MKQAGKPKGFAHVGGKAQDLSVAKLDKYQKEIFLKFLEKNGVAVLLEYVDKNNSKYGVTISRANTFHCT